MAVPQIPLYAPVLDDDDIHISRVWQRYFDDGFAQVSSGGSVNSVSGTAPIVVTGTTNPIVSLAGHGVANPYLAQMPAVTLKGNNTGSTANAADLTVSQVISMLGLSSAITGAGTANNVTMFIAPNMVGNAPNFTYDPAEGGSYTISGALEVVGSIYGTDIYSSGALQGTALSAGTGIIDSLTITTSETINYLTASLPVFTNGANKLVSNPITGTGNVMMSASPTTTGTMTAGNINAGGSVHAGDVAVTNYVNISGAVANASYGVNILGRSYAASGSNGYDSFGVGVPGDANTESVSMFHSAGLGGGILQVNKTGTGTYRSLIIQTGGSTAITIAASHAVTLVSTISASNLSGTNTGDQTTITGNAGSATVLQTARTINGVSFDGSANITVTAAAGTLTGGTLAAGVTASSLTSVGTLSSLAVSGNITLGARLNINGATDTAGYGINALQSNIATTRSGGGGGHLYSFGLGSPAAADAEMIDIVHDNTNGAIIQVIQAGTGSYRDLLFKTGGSTRLTINTSGICAFTGRLNVNGATDSSSYAVNVKDKIIAVTGGASSNGFYAFGVGVPGDANAEFGGLLHSGSALALISSQSGTGTARPISMQIGGTVALTMSASAALFGVELKLDAANTVNASVLSTVTNKIKVVVGGTTYYLLASTSNA